MAEGNSTHTIDAHASWRVLFLGMLRPDTYMRLTGSSLSGVAHFYRAFGLYCMLPVVLLNVAAIIAAGQSPGAWIFQDIAPWTVVIGVPVQLIIGPLNIWIITWCLYGGMSAVGLNPANAKERVLTTGWYVGTTLHCLGYWCLGFGIFFSSIRAIHRISEPVLTAGLMIGLAIWLKVALSAYRVNVPECGGSTADKTFTGLLVGALLFFPAAFPIVAVLQLIVFVVVTILRGT